MTFRLARALRSGVDSPRSVVVGDARVPAARERRLVPRPA
jgi:hypothetical protein